MLGIIDIRQILLEKGGLGVLIIVPRCDIRAISGAPIGAAFFAVRCLWVDFLNGNVNEIGCFHGDFDRALAGWVRSITCHTVCHLELCRIVLQHGLNIYLIANLFFVLLNRNPLLLGTIVALVHKLATLEPPLQKQPLLVADADWLLL